MKFQTGSTFIGKSKSDEEYENLLKKETIEECLNFSKLCFEKSNQFGKISEGRAEIKAKVSQIKTLEKENEDILLKYFEHLILDNNNTEFLIPYYSINNELNNQIASDISVYENHHFGILGDVNEILS